MGFGSEFILFFCVILFCITLRPFNALPIDDPIIYSAQSSMSSASSGPNGSYQSVQTQSTDQDGNTIVHSQTSDGPGLSSITSYTGRKCIKELFFLSGQNNEI